MYCVVSKFLKIYFTQRKGVAIWNVNHADMNTKAFAPNAVAKWLVADRADTSTVTRRVNAVAPNKYLMKSITVYSTVTCPYCQHEKQWLDKHGVKYDHYLVDQDQEKADEMIKKSGQMGVPVTEIVTDDGKSEIVIGFDKTKLGELLGIKE